MAKKVQPKEASVIDEAKERRRERDRLRREAEAARISDIRAAYEIGDLISVGILTSKTDIMPHRVIIVFDITEKPINNVILDCFSSIRMMTFGNTLLPFKYVPNAVTLPYQGNNNHAAFDLIVVDDDNRFIYEPHGAPMVFNANHDIIKATLYFAGREKVDVVRDPRG